MAIYHFLFPVLNQNAIKHFAEEDSQELLKDSDYNSKESPTITLSLFYDYLASLSFLLLEDSCLEASLLFLRLLTERVGKFSLFHLSGYFSFL